GPRGCSHVLTLAQLLGATVPTALAVDRARFGAMPARRPGERIFRRDVIVDGHERGPSTVALALQATDLHHAPAAAIAPSMTRFAGEHEVRGLAEIDLARFGLTSLALGERRRDAATLDTATWRDRADLAEPLTGLSLAGGLSQALLARRTDAGEDRPLFDVLL